MVDELKEMGIELMVSVWPQVDLESENYEEMRNKGLLVKPEMGVNISMLFGGYSNFFDATNPEAREFVWEKCKRIIMIMALKSSGLMKQNLNLVYMILITTDTI